MVALDPSCCCVEEPLTVELVGNSSGNAAVDKVYEFSTDSTVGLSYDRPTDNCNCAADAAEW